MIGSDSRISFTDEDKVVRGTQFRAIFRRARASGCGLPFTFSPSDFKSRAPGTGSEGSRGASNPLYRSASIPGFRPRPVFEIFVPEYWQHNYGSVSFSGTRSSSLERKENGKRTNWPHHSDRCREPRFTSTCSTRYCTANS